MSKYICNDYKVINVADSVFYIDSHYGMIEANLCLAQDLLSYDDYIKMGFDENQCETLNVICISQLTIDKAFTGQGLGKDLLKKVLDYCNKKFPTTQIYLCAEPLGHKTLDLDNLKEFYNKQGFITMFDKKNCSYMLYKKK